MNSSSKDLIVNVRQCGNYNPKFMPMQSTRIGLYSVTKEREYLNTTDNLKYLYLPKELPINLDEGYMTAFKKNPTEKLYLNHLLYFIRDHQDALISRSELASEPSRLKADVVCYRSTLAYIMNSTYNKLREWRLLVSKLNGTIYMIEEESPKQEFERLNQPNDHKRMCAWGFKFEQFCTTHDPKVEPYCDQPVDECSGLGCMYRGILNGYTYLYAAEIDAIESPELIKGEITPEVLQNLNFIELKTKIKQPAPNQQFNFLKHYSRSWWLQSYLAGIENIYVGLRDVKGSVDEIQTYSAKAILKDAGNRQRDGWRGSVCLKFLDTFKQTIETAMEFVTDPNTVMQVDFDCDSAVISCKFLHGLNEKSFLPTWYQDLMNNKPSTTPYFKSFAKMILKFFHSLYQHLVGRLPSL